MMGGIATLVSLVVLVVGAMATESMEHGLRDLLQDIKEIHEKLDKRHRAATDTLTNNLARGDGMEWKQLMHTVQQQIDDLKSKIASLNGQLESECQCGDKSCQSGWTKFQNSCFYLETRYMTWDHASLNCQQLGGHLAHVKNQATDRFLVKWITDQYTSLGIHGYGPWLGATDRLNEGAWNWETPISYTNWFGGTTNGGTSENCLHYYYSNRFQWNDAGCSSYHFTSVCEN